MIVTVFPLCRLPSLVFIIVSPFPGYRRVRFGRLASFNSAAIIPYNDSKVKRIIGRIGKNVSDILT